MQIDAKAFDTLMRANDEAIKQAVGRAKSAERERIAVALMAEADASPCEQDAQVLRDSAWLVRADFSYEEADRLQSAAQNAG